MIPPLFVDVPAPVLNALPSPCYAICREALERNMAVFADIKARTGAELLLALKGFSTYGVFDRMRDTLDGVCASGLWEAQLGRRHFGKRVHTFSPAYEPDDLPKIIALSDSVLFNSFAQWKHAAAARKMAPPEKIFGLRVNPGYSEVETALYDPCSAQSRLGIRSEQFENEDLSGVSELHFHALCEQNSDTLERVLHSFEARFAHILSLPQIKYVNFGGGHHLTRPDYDRERLINLINSFKARYNVQVILEPGEATVLNSGVLIATVLDIVPNPMPVAILNLSVSCHMPDVLEMPYRPFITGAGEPGEKAFTYLLGGNSCLAGDVCGPYSFDAPLKVGDKLIFQDMAHYTTVKTTFFNGVKHPAIAEFSRETNAVRMLRTFTYADFEARLGE